MSSWGKPWLLAFVFITQAIRHAWGSARCPRCVRSSSAFSRSAAPSARLLACFRLHYNPGSIRADSKGDTCGDAERMDRWTDGGAEPGRDGRRQDRACGRGGRGRTGEGRQCGRCGRHDQLRGRRRRAMDERHWRWRLHGHPPTRRGPRDRHLLPDDRPGQRDRGHVSARRCGPGLLRLAGGRRQCERGRPPFRGRAWHRRRIGPRAGAIRHDLMGRSDRPGDRVCRARLPGDVAYDAQDRAGPRPDHR